MKLLTKDILKKLPNPDEQDGRIYVKYFHPFSSWTWYAMEYDRDNEMFFGFVYGQTHYGELGSFALSDLTDTKVMGLPIERDLYWNDKTTLKEVQSASANGFPL